MRAARIAAVAALGLVGVMAVAGCSSQSRESGDNAQLGRPNSGAAPEAASGAGSGGNADSGGMARQESARQNVPAQERHVVRTAALRVRVDDIFAASAGARGVAERFGGFVASEQTDTEEATLALKVATDRLDEALTALDDLGDVAHREQQAEDVTEQVVDIEVRIANQRASVERVRALLAEAKTVNEIMQIEEELTKRQAELESLEKRAATLAGQTELATVDVTFSSRGAPVVDERSGFLAGLESGWNAFVTTATVMLTVLGALLPFLLALGLPVLAVLMLARRRQRQVAARSTGAVNG